MKRAELKELHYITPMKNVASILELGILSHERARKVKHTSVAMSEIQSLRKPKAVPGGRPLHEYVNLYLCARNPMLFKRKASHLDLCVLQVDIAVLEFDDVVIADGNAASDYTAFRPSPSGLAKVDSERVFAEYWTDEDPIEQMRRKRVKCAEVLVPEVVPPRHVLGAYVSCDEARTSLREIARSFRVTVDPHLFFQASEA